MTESAEPRHCGGADDRRGAGRSPQLAAESSLVRRYLLILAAILAAVAGVVVLALFRTPTLGLDLQGGLEVILQAKAPQGREITQEDLDRSIEIMRQRIDKLGVSEPVITRQGSDQISVRARRRPRCRPRGRDHRPDRAAPVLRPPGRRACRRPRARTAGSARSPTPAAPVRASRRRRRRARRPQWYLYSKDKTRLAGPEPRRRKTSSGSSAASSRRAPSSTPSPRARSSSPATDTRDALSRGVGVPAPGATYYYLFKYEPTNADEADPGADRERPERGRHATGLRPGQRAHRQARLHDIAAGTSSTRSRASSRSAGRTRRTSRAQPGNSDFSQSFAIVLDGEIRSFPPIDFADLR